MRVSVIIPSYNSRERLYYNLITLNNQDCDYDTFEVVVVDNGSNDNTIEMLKEFESKYPLKFVRVKENKGIAHGRNEGVKRAEGDILIFHDSDMLAPIDFITRHLKHHEEGNIVVCGVPWKRINTFYYKELEKAGLNYKDDILPIYGMDIDDIKMDKQPLISSESIVDRSYLNYIYNLDTDFMKILKGILDRYGDNFRDYALPWRFFITNNVSVERSRVIQVGMFDESIVGYGYEDYDLGIRLYKSGSKFVFDKDILNVHQEHPSNIRISEAHDNVNYICSKYNNVYFLDVILVCVSYVTSIDGSTINELVIDINNMLPVTSFRRLLEIFLELIQTCRKRFFVEGVKDRYSIMPNIYINLEELIMELKYLRDEFGIKYFTEAMLALIRDIYRI